jgi:hypothetical protein
MENNIVEDSLFSIQTYLNPDIFGNEELVQQISQHLIEGDLVIIRNVLKETFAERMFACLDCFSGWKLFEDSSENFHYHHHNIYDHDLFPTDLKWCYQIFQSESTKNFIRRLSQKDCKGGTGFSASWYMPGDHSLPHDDSVYKNNGYRQVAFVWHLTKNWQPSWGGDFFWCPKSYSLSPSFNTLLLFNVKGHKLHFVTVVSPHVQSKRLAINGWWYGETDPDDPPTSAHHSSIRTQQLVEFI